MSKHKVKYIEYQSKMLNVKYESCQCIKLNASHVKNVKCKSHQSKILNIHHIEVKC